MALSIIFVLLPQHPSHSLRDCHDFYASRATTPTPGMSTTKPMRRQRQKHLTSRTLLATIFMLNVLPGASASPVDNSHLPRPLSARTVYPNREVHWGPPTKRDNTIPLVISNNCGETIWPGIGSQAGTGPGTGGFALTTGNSTTLTVSADWQGRVWGRSNCSFNVGGTGPSNLNGNNGNGEACDTGDCNGVLSCVVTVRIPC